MQADLLEGKHLYETVAAQAPVEDAVLVDIIALPNLESAVLREILVKHSPLSTAVSDALAARAKPLEDSDQRMVDAAQ